MTRRALLAAFAASSLVAMTIAVSGGAVASVGGVRLSARSPRLALAIALLSGAAWLAAARRAGGVRADLSAWSGAVDRHGRVVVSALAIAVGTASLAMGSASASGADASGYLSQAALWAGLDWRLADPLASSPGWPLPPSATAPLGWRPAAEGGWQVPTYAPGLPWLMAVPFSVAGNAGAFAVVAVAAALAVWAAGTLGRALGGAAAGVMAAAFLASSPTFIFQSLQPMSDVPVAAAWALGWLAVAFAHPAIGGVSAALAVLIRPNLAPLAAVPALWLLMAATPREARVRSALAFSAPVAAAGLAIALLQWCWYGTPLRSGYGTAEELFALANVVPNLRLYAGWIWQAEVTFVIGVMVGVVGLARSGRRIDIGVEPRPPASIRAGLAVFTAGVIVAYLVYAQFEIWTYLRFLLPAMAMVAPLAGAGLARLIGRAPVEARGLVVTALASAVMASGVWQARRLQVFDVAAQAARATEAGGRLASVLPANAVLIAAEQSGSMRHETGRPVLRWDLLDAEALVRALGALEARGLEGWWVLDQREEAAVRGRFPGVRAAAMDWPPRVEGGRLMQTRAWRIADKN